jgi:hypothetical protein
MFFASAWLYCVVPVSGVANVLHQLTWCPLSFVCGGTDAAGGGFIGTATARMQSMLAEDFAYHPRKLQPPREQAGIRTAHLSQSKE